MKRALAVAVAAGLSAVAFTATPSAAKTAKGTTTVAADATIVAGRDAAASVAATACANTTKAATARVVVKAGDISITYKLRCADVAAASAVTTTTSAQAEGGIMPDVVCMNLQDAQDLIQENGIFFSRSEDATGQGRLQIIDSNWRVVAQDPPPDSPIGEGDAVLSVVREGEPSSC